MSSSKHSRKIKGSSSPASRKDTDAHDRKSSQKDSRWESSGSLSSSSRKPLDLTGEEQLARVNAIVDLENPGFAPQNFHSKRLSTKEKEKTSDRKDSNKGGSKMLSGPVEDLISPVLIPGTEKERLVRQAQNLTVMRNELLRKRSEFAPG